MSQSSTSSVDSEELKKKLQSMSSTSSSRIRKSISASGSGSKRHSRDSSDSGSAQKVRRSSGSQGSQTSSTRRGSQESRHSFTSLDKDEPSSERIAKHLVSELLDVVYQKEDEWLEILDTPNLALDKIKAKAFLQKPSPKEGISVFEHLNELVKKILSEKPINVIEYFEEYSRNMKEERFRPATDHLQDIYIPPEQYDYAKKYMELFSLPPDAEPEEALDEEEPTESTNPDMMELQYFFEKANIGIPRCEMFLIALSMRKLQQSQPIQTIRFWGKILGTRRNYIVVETVLPDEEYEKRNAEPEEKEGGEGEEGEGGGEPEPPPVAEPIPEEPEEEKEIGGEEIGAGDAPPKETPLPPIPQSPFVLPPEVPAERAGEGLNKKVYYVCNEPGNEWVGLPDVTPQQINAARKIRRYFTGDLDTEIFTYPEFPGTERNYLRAQIARISAGTQVSPLGFYHFSEEEEEVEEEEAAKTEYVENPDYDPVPLKDLLDPTMSFWVHHALPILKQGRTTWWNPKGKSDEEAEEEEAEEEEAKEGQEEPEVGPPVLTPLSEDATLETIPPWSVRQSSNLLADFAIAFIRSNIWPGAHAFARGKKFDNIYIGWGHKYVSYNYSPPPIDAIQNEYPLGPEIMEIMDPTVEEEEAWRLSQEKKKEVPKPEGEEEEEEGEGEEGDEDEEDEDEDD